MGTIYTSVTMVYRLFYILKLAKKLEWQRKLLSETENLEQYEMAKRALPWLTVDSIGRQDR